MALRDLESCCIGLQEIFRRFQRHPKLFTGEGAPAAPMKFGVHGARVDADCARLYQQIVTEVASMLVLAAHNSFEAMSSIEDGEIDAPEDGVLRLRRAAGAAEQADPGPRHAEG